MHPTKAHLYCIMGGCDRVDKVVSVGIGLMSTHGFESPPVQQPLKLCVICRVA